ncbi:hypothetical protein BDN70DRAFT_870985 [Pholiota conissans]|uniref:Uncharacterized protein n=1 Tax=Pholiota conissans TaxID=109636 RepID=A0A9P6CYV2_9AGAR|nr:hypothetical protein BDN70DRAFT_870985 [Pholiota conissans]
MAPPFENFNLFTPSNAYKGGFYITSDVVGFTVGTIHLTESNLFLPLVASPFADPPIPATTYAIERAGGGAFVIKAIDAEVLWTSIPAVDPTDPETGNAIIQMLPADGGSHQIFFLHSA